MQNLQIQVNINLRVTIKSIKRFDYSAAETGFFNTLSFGVAGVR